MIVLKILRFILPPFHPLKYKWIDYKYSNKKIKVNKFGESFLPKLKTK